jgi:oligoendopeptidase F
MKKEILNWNLKDIVEIKDFDKLINNINKEIKKITIYYEHLSPDMNTKKFIEIIHFYEKLNDMIHRLICMPRLMEAKNQKDENAKLLSNKAKDISLKVEEESMKTWLWIQGKKTYGKKKLDDKNAKRLFSSEKKLEYTLHSLRKGKKYSFNEKEEIISAKKNTTGISVIKDLRRVITSEFKYKFKVKNKKEIIIDNRETLMNYVYSKDPNEREACYKALFLTHQKNIDKLFMIYQAIVKDWVQMGEMRGYKTPISKRNFYNDIPDKAIEILLKVCEEEKETYHQYFLWKAKELNINKLKRFDIYAPLNTKHKKYTFNESLNLVINTFKSFSPEFTKKALKIIKEKHIDSHPIKYKQDGAFCMTISPKITPYIMLNFKGNDEDISTIAHELGHGIHSLYANKQSISAQSAPLPLAETASTFCEMIIFEKLFQETKDKKIKKSMLSKKIADSYATIIRQNYFVKFEIEAHKQINKGISYEELSEIYLNNLKEQFGNSVEIDNLFRYEWSGIPHIFESPFYCYAYNFGELLSLSLYQRYKKEGNSFIPKIERILSYGGSKNPNKILKEIGIDMCDEKFWKESFQIIKDWQKQLESL